MMLNNVVLGLGGGSLLQVANRSFVQMMSYFIETPDGKTVVIDGGYNCPEDGEHLRDLIEKRGNKVDLWFITHAHDDHFGALLYLLENNDKLDFKIENMCFNFPEAEWFKGVENEKVYELYFRFLSQLNRHGIECQKLCEGNVLECGGMTFEIINDCRNYNDYNNVNDTSTLILAHFPKRDVLFLGDLGEKGGKYFLDNFDVSKIRCDIVQMAHHGQRGVNKEFYERVKPEICLYTAPDWLWENDNGGGKGSGPWLTLQTREWMEELSVKNSYPCAYGDYLFE